MLRVSRRMVHRLSDGLRRCVGGATLVAVAVLASACGESSDAQPLPTPTPSGRAPTHYVAIVDRSSSITPAESEVFRAKVTELIDGLSYRDRLDIFVAYAEGRGAGTEKISREMPEARNPANPLDREKRALESARESLLRASEGVFATGTAEYTDLVNSLRDAEEYLRASSLDSRVLIFFSDMLQCVPGDRAGCMDTQGWRSTGPAPELLVESSGLQDACVWFFGVETASERDVSVRDYWLRYLEGAGAKVDPRRWYHSAGPTPSPGC